MKRCPECRRNYYDETLLYCLDDGTALLDGPGSLEPPTSVLPIEKSEAPTRQQITTTGETALLTSQTADDLKQGKRRKGLVAAVLGIVLIAVAALAFGGYRLYLYFNTPPPRVATAINTQRLTGDGKTRAAEISPDGKFLAYLRTEGGERSLWLKQIQTNSNIPIVKPGEFERLDSLSFSPDGNFVYFNGQTKTGGPPLVRAERTGNAVMITDYR
jgi:hypothetical protein